MFPRLDPKMYPIADDQQFAYELLAEEKVLIVQGTGFNWPTPDHFRLVFLPNSDDLTEAIGAHRALPRALPQTPRPYETARRSAMKPIQVGLLGIGTVGSGTFKVLQRNQEEIQPPRRPRHRDHDGGRPRHRARAGRSSATRVRVVADAREVIANPEIDIVIELIGGYGIARSAGDGGDRRRQARGHRQQGAARGARHRDLRRGAREGRDGRLRGGGGRRHPDHQGAARRA